MRPVFPLCPQWLVFTQIWLTWLDTILTKRSLICRLHRLFTIVLVFFSNGGSREGQSVAVAPLSSLVYSLCTHISHLNLSRFRILTYYRAPSVKKFRFKMVLKLAFEMLLNGLNSKYFEFGIIQSLWSAIRKKIPVQNGFEVGFRNAFEWTKFEIFFGCIRLCSQRSFKLEKNFWKGLW